MPESRPFLFGHKPAEVQRGSLKVFGHTVGHYPNKAMSCAQALVGSNPTDRNLFCPNGIAIRVVPLAIASRSIASCWPLHPDFVCFVHMYLRTPDVNVYIFQVIRLTFVTYKRCKQSIHTCPPDKHQVPSNRIKSALVQSSSPPSRPPPSSPPPSSAPPSTARIATNRSVVRTSLSQL